jgi:hypothetical protein
MNRPLNPQPVTAMEGQSNDSMGGRGGHAQMLPRTARGSVLLAWLVNMLRQLQQNIINRPTRDEYTEETEMLWVLYHIYPNSAAADLYHAAMEVAIQQQPPSPMPLRDMYAAC